MANVPSHLKYTDQHEWVKLDGDVVTVGVTDFAQHALGDLVFVELPSLGKIVKAGDSFAVVESVKSASEVYSPVSGEVVEVNNTLTQSPEMINQSPYDAGWLCKIRLSNTSEVSALMDAQKYQELAA